MDIKKVLMHEKFNNNYVSNLLSTTIFTQSISYILKQRARVRGGAATNIEMKFSVFSRGQRWASILYLKV
jgi:hypothetical protein